MKKVLYNNQKIIIFVLSLKHYDMKKSKERRKAEKDLLYYLQIYSELRGRYDTGESLAYFSMLIDELVEKIKNM